MTSLIFTAVLIFRVNIRFLVGNIRCDTITVYCTEGQHVSKTSKTVYYMKIMVCKFPPGAKPFLACYTRFINFGQGLTLKTLFVSPHSSIVQIIFYFGPLKSWNIF